MGDTAVVTGSTPATATAFDASGATLSTATMSGSQFVIETLQLTGPGITRIRIDAPTQETLLLQICCAP